VLIVLLLALNMAFNTTGHICFKLSARGNDRRRFIAFQVAGNLAGFLGVLAFTALLRVMSLHTAYPATQGLTAVGVQVVGSGLVFRERLSPFSWAGTALIVAGVALIG